MAFNLFPQTDFRQMDLNWVLAEVKRASNLTDRVDGLEADVDGLNAEIRDPETGLWKAISDIHAANSSQQAQINALIAAQVFARPEDYGATGDGVADDTAALQAALNSDKPVYLKGTYGISDTIRVNKDKIILCGESAVIKTLGRVTYALRFGDDPTTGPDAAIPGLIQVLWYGGTLTCDTTNYFDYGFSFERCLNSCFYGVTVTNCVGTGFRWGGDYGASTICDNCIVRGPDSGYYGVTGFLVGRNDQRVYNCSAVNMTTGFFTDRGYVRFEGCYCWITRAREADLQNVVAYDIVSPNCAVIDCTADTVPTGIKLHPTSQNFYGQGLAWYSATSVIADPTGFALFRGSEAGLVCNGFVTGVASSPWPDPVRICTDVSGLTIIGFMIPDMTNIQDPDSVTQVSDVGSNTNKINKVTYTEPYQTETETLITPTFTSGYIDTGGTPRSSGSYQYTQKISVSAGNAVSLIATSGTSNMRFICAYAGNSAVSASGISSDTGIYTVPNGIDGVVISCYSASTITKVRILSYSDDTATHIVTIPFGYMMSAGNLSDGNSLTLPVQNSKIYNRLVFDARITSFNSVKIKKNIHSFEVNGTNLILTGYGSTPSVTVAHGLTISDTITILIENNTDEKTNLIRISSKGVEFDYTTPFEYNVGKGAWSVISNGSTLTNCTLSWTSKVIDTNLWLFGDSYFSLYATRWTYYLVRDGFADNCMLNGFAGENSLDALNGLKNLLIVTSPKYVVWCLGMNDADSSTAVNTSWKNVYDKVINLSKQYGFTPIFSTIPTTPTVNNNFKNAIIRESGYRYIDVDSAVRIANSTSWIDGTMEDTVHPNALGAKIIYNKFLADLPELMITK